MDRIVVLTITFAVAMMGVLPLTAGYGARSSTTCFKPSKTQRLTFSRSLYPHIRRHFLRAVRKGWPRILVLNRRGAEARRERLLESYPLSLVMTATNIRQR